MSEICNAMEVLQLPALMQTIENEAELLQSLQLDVLTLDVSWIEQPALSYRWNKMHNIAEYHLKRREKKLVDLKASLYLETRASFMENKEKFTEAVLTNTVAAVGSVSELQDEISDLQYICSLLISTKKAVDDRRRALEGLVSLHSTQYFTNGTNNPILEELGNQQVEEQHHKVLSNNKRLRKLRDRKQGVKNES